ncbi:MAG: site-specific DNA-methyltransferase [Gammaproteobacteria bacterium]|nr:site-specific DNA-methyltransferase [Gammaproteobacteria bacterium]
MSENTMPDKMSGETLDISEQRKQELKQLFPGVFTETTDAKGEIVETIDFEKLKAELGSFSDVYEGRRERYGMEWPGKRDCMKLIQEPSRATLKPCREESVDFDNTENLFIEGDNLEVLKLLQKSYYGKVKMIYIDPPYNTGKEFIYPDNYKESLETYMAYSGLVDDDGKKFTTNTASEGRFHTKWLNMMFPRLYLARNLLREDGVIFISIDDNEVENLRRMCDEIFGEENLLACFSWRTDGNFDNQAKIKNCHEYILCYTRNEAFFPHPPVIDPNTSEDSKIFKSEIRNTVVKNGPKNPVSDIVLPIGFPAIFSEGVVEPRDDSWPHYLTVANFKDGKLTSPVIVRSGWSSKVLLEAFIVNKFQPVLDSKGQSTCFEVIASGAIEAVKERSDTQSHVISSLAGFGGSQKAASEIESLGLVFDDYPKPTSLIDYFVKMNEGDDFVVVDFFAGSGTTSHSVFNVKSDNNSEKQKIKFISVQLPEPCQETTKAFQAGFETIADVCKERIRRAGQKIRQEREGQLDLEGRGELDLGFKVLKLDQSNFKQWQTPSGELDADQIGKTLDAFANHIDPDATQEEILYELLLKAGYLPTDKIETLDLAGKQVFSIRDGELLICLEEEITAELIDEVVELVFGQFICLDKSFQGNNQLKVNAVQTFKSRSQNSETEMVFKVV